jgi:hypothetical protein
MLIYKQLGASAQEEFAKTWGIGYALDNASEWQEVVKTAAQAAVILVRAPAHASLDICTQMLPACRRQHFNIALFSTFSPLTLLPGAPCRFCLTCCASHGA